MLKKILTLTFFLDFYHFPLCLLELAHYTCFFSVRDQYQGLASIRVSTLSLRHILSPEGLPTSSPWQDLLQLNFSKCDLVSDTVCIRFLHILGSHYSH